jgi:hypothetical protein
MARTVAVTVDAINPAMHPCDSDKRTRIRKIYREFAAVALKL